jgi:hypothetical protein
MGKIFPGYDGSRQSMSVPFQSLVIGLQVCFLSLFAQDMANSERQILDAPEQGNCLLRLDVRSTLKLSNSRSGLGRVQPILGQTYD